MIFRGFDKTFRVVFKSFYLSSSASPAIALLGEGGFFILSKQVPNYVIPSASPSYVISPAGPSYVITSAGKQVSILSYLRLRFHEFGFRHRQYPP